MRLRNDLALTKGIFLSTPTNGLNYATDASVSTVKSNVQNLIVDILNVLDTVPIPVSSMSHASALILLHIPTAYRKHVTNDFSVFQKIETPHIEQNKDCVMERLIRIEMELQKLIFNSKSKRLCNFQRWVERNFQVHFKCCLKVQKCIMSED